MLRSSIYYNSLNHCPGCNKDLTGNSNRSKSTHRSVCLKFQISIGNDTKRLELRRSRCVNTRLKEGTCIFSKKNRPKDELGRDIIARRSADTKNENNLWYFSKENRPKDRLGRDLLSLGRVARGTHPWLSKNLKVDETGKYITANKISDSRCKNGTHPWSSDNLPEDWIPPYRRMSRFRYQDKYMRSSWEVKFASQLDQMSIDWDYESHIFKYISTDGLEHRYIPDFFIPSFGYVEIKPSALVDEIVNLKLGSVRKSGCVIYLMTEKNWYDIISSLNVRFRLYRRLLSA